MLSTNYYTLSRTIASNTLYVALYGVNSLIVNCTKAYTTQVRLHQASSALNSYTCAHISAAGGSDAVHRYRYCGNLLYLLGRCYFNVRSKADMSQLNLLARNQTKQVERRKTKS